MALQTVGNFLSFNKRENVQLQPHNITLLLMFYITSTLQFFFVLRPMNARSTAIRPSVVTVTP